MLQRPVPGMSQPAQEWPPALKVDKVSANLSLVVRICESMERKRCDQSGLQEVSREDSGDL
jgi:hypothetical protein